MERRDNYQIQMQQAKRRFVTYDQRELIRRCDLRHDSTYLYAKMLARSYRIDRKSGDVEYAQGDTWVSGNSFSEVLTLFDWMCDSRSDRCLAGRFIDPVTHGHYFHRELQEGLSSYADLFDRQPEAFCAACEALRGEKMPGGDISYAIELVDGLRILVQLWHGDEEFAPRLRCLWDENYSQYLRYETTWYAKGMLLQRLADQIQKL